jgi:hypothetical protein
MTEGNISSRPTPPGTLAELVELIGEEAVLRLLETRGGTVIYIPGDMTPTRSLAAELKLTAAQCKKLATWRHVRDRYRVPLCRDWRAQLYRWQGFSYNEIARKLGITDRAVFRLLRDANMTTPQMSLPL